MTPNERRRFSLIPADVGLPVPRAYRCAPVIDVGRVGHSRDGMRCWVRPSGVPSPGGDAYKPPQGFGRPSVGVRSSAGNRPTAPWGAGGSRGEAVLVPWAPNLGPPGGELRFPPRHPRSCQESLSGPVTTRFTPPGVSDEGGGPSRRPVGQRRAGDSRARGDPGLQPRPVLRRGGGCGPW